jgi:hypothetical protein
MGGVHGGGVHGAGACSGRMQRAHGAGAWGAPHAATEPPGRPLARPRRAGRQQLAVPLLVPMLEYQLRVRRAA